MQQTERNSSMLHVGSEQCIKLRDLAFIGQALHVFA